MFIPLSDSTPEEGDYCLVLFLGKRNLPGNESCYSLFSLQWDVEYQAFCFNDGMPLVAVEMDGEEIIGWVKNDILLI